MNRRRFLSALGLASATLWLPSLTRGVAGEAPPKRLIVLLTQHGTWHEAWKIRPPGAADDARWSADLRAMPEADFSPILRPLHRHRSRMLVVDGLALASGEVDRVGTRHEVGTRHATTGAMTSPLVGRAMPGGASIDQIVAAALADPNRFPSLQIAVGSRQNTYVSSASASGGLLVPTSSPLALRSRLFGYDPTTSAATSLAAQAAVLDRVGTMYDQLSARMSGDDRRKLALHRDLVSDLGARLDGLAAVSCPTPDVDVTGGTYDLDFDAFAHLVTSAVSCDLCRVFSLELTTQDADPLMPGFTGDLHLDVAHDAFERPEAAATMTAYGEHHARQIAALLDLLDGVPEGDGTLLDRTLVCWLNDMGDPAHGFDRWSAVLFGGGTLPQGQLHHFPATTPIAPLYDRGRGPDRIGPPHQHLLVTIAQAMGLDVDTVGVATLTGDRGEAIDCRGPLDLAV